jgi:hypothetical protein
VLSARFGNLERAGTLVGAAEASRGDYPFAPFRARPEFEQAVAAIRDVLGEAGFETAKARGAAMSVRDMLTLAQSALS